jgi:formylglycine-generating enzyme required for sulfatase activity
MGSNPSYFSSNPAEGEVQENRPVENVSWFDALVYCNKRSVEAGLTPYYKVGGNTEVSTWGYTPHTGASIIGTITTDESANGFRLPTVSEWKYAASGGKDATPYTYSGSGTISEVAWYVSNSGNKTHEVMKCSKANKLGLYDMSGNVLEWCWDPPTEGATTRIRIGGYWKSDAGGCVIKPDSYNSNSRESQSGSLETCGFRVVRNTY